MDGMKGLDHAKMEELLSAYADGELPAALREVVAQHLDECAECQRNLAEFRLAGQHLALLTDPDLSAWEPDLAARVNERIAQRRNWFGFGRRLALNAARAAAAVALIAGIVWLFGRLPESAPGEAGTPQAPVGGPEVTRVVATPTSPRTPFKTYIPPSPTIPTAQEPSIHIVREGETLRAIAEALAVDVELLAEYNDLGAQERVVRVGQVILIPSEGELPPPTPTATPPALDPRMVSSAFRYTSLQSADGRTTLFLFGDVFLVQSPDQGAIRNLGFGLLSTGDAYLIVESASGQQSVLRAEQSPSIYPPVGAEPGEPVRIFAVTPDGAITQAATFELTLDGNGWQASEVRPVQDAPELRVALPTPSVQALGPGTPPAAQGSPPAEMAALRLARLAIAPANPRQGQPYIVSALVRNESRVEARVPVWFAAFVGEDPYPSAVSPTFYVTVPADGEVELHWDGRDTWGREDVTLQTRWLVFRAGVNVLIPGVGPHPSMVPELDKYDNEAELSAAFEPYEPEVSDACAPGDNLRLELTSEVRYQSDTGRPVLKVLVTNDGNVEVERVPLGAVDALGLRYRTYARRVPPCGGVVAVGVQEGLSAFPLDQMTLPITLTLNDPSSVDALAESDHSDNVLVVTTADIPCSGPTDLWLAEEDVAFDGEDLLVTVHLSGTPPRGSFWVRVFHATDGRSLGERNLRMADCAEPAQVRFGGLLTGLEDGWLMVQIDTEENRLEAFYPQGNNAVTVKWER